MKITIDLNTDAYSPEYESFMDRFYQKVALHGGSIKGTTGNIYREEGPVDIARKNNRYDRKSDYTPKRIEEAFERFAKYSEILDECEQKLADARDDRDRYEFILKKSGAQKEFWVWKYPEIYRKLVESKIKVALLNDECVKYRQILRTENRVLDSRIAHEYPGYGYLLGED